MRGNQCIDEALRFENLEIQGFLTDSDETQWQTERLGDSKYHATPGGAIEFGQHEPRERGYLGEGFGLSQRVLPRPRVEHKEHRMGRRRIKALQHPDHLGELLHEVTFVMKPPRRIR